MAEKTKEPKTKESKPKTRPYMVFGAPTIGEEEIAEVVACLRSGWLGTGPRVQKFEEAFGRYVGAPHAVAVNSCTAALHLSMLVAGVGPGDEVITTPLTFCATTNAILHTGAVPVYADVDPKTQLLDPAKVEQKITKKTKAILPVHLHGRPCDIGAFRKIAGRHKLVLVEDAAHAIETKWRGQKVGTTADISCFSFYVTKNMTTAEGGMVTTARKEWADLLKMYALHGMSQDAWKRFSDDGYRHYSIVAAGFKYNMTDIQASIGLHQLGKLGPWLTRREQIWATYDRELAGLPCELPPAPEPDTLHARHLYTILIDPKKSPVTRDRFMGEMHKRGIGTGCHYQALHLHEFYGKKLGVARGDFPGAEHVSDRTVSLPLSQKMTDDEVAFVVAQVREILRPA